MALLQSCAKPAHWASRTHEENGSPVGGPIQDEVLPDSVLGSPEWRFCHRLEPRLTLAHQARTVLSAPDTASQAWLDLAARHWKTGSAFAGARGHRLSTRTNVDMKTVSNMLNSVRKLY